MTCEHINNIAKKVKDLVGYYNDTSSFLYETTKPYIEADEVKDCVAALKWDSLSDDVKRTDEDPFIILNRLFNFFKKYEKISIYTSKNINRSVLYNQLSNIFDEVKRCNCRNDVVGKHNELLTKHNNNVNDYNQLRNEYNELVNKFNNLSKDSVRDYNDLKDKHNELVDKFNDKNRDYQEYKEKYEESKEELHSEQLKNAKSSGIERSKHLEEKFQLQEQNTKLQERLESVSAKVIDLGKRLTNTEDENNKLLIKLDEKSVIYNQRLEDLNNQITSLKLESGKKDRELEKRNEDIESLKGRVGFSEEELLIEKLRSEKENLELFATELKIDLEKIESLSGDYKQLFQVKKVRNRTNIATHDNNISQTKRDLQGSGISIVNVQEICRKCERIAELSWQLEQVQQQFQAQQEVPTNN